MQLISEVKQFFGDAGFQPFGYTGYQKEEAGGLYYAQARRYDADTGRFISEDMSGDMDGFQIGLVGGAGVNIHMMESNTKEIYTYNLFQTIGNVLENFSGESRLECEN